MMLLNGFYLILKRGVKMTNLAAYIPKFKEQKILLLGDLIADEFITGQPERLSREAPVLILRHESEEILPGGGANAANNLAALGSQVHLAGLVGDDVVGKKFKSQLDELGMATEGVVVDSNRPTSVKTRILAGGGQTVKQQVTRIDKLDQSLISDEIERRLITYLKKAITKVDAVLLSDYGNGIFRDSLKKEAIAIANEHDKIIALDSRYQLTSFKGVSIATPNKEETEKAVGFTLDSEEKITKAGWQLKKELEADAMLITLGGEGMQIFTEQGTTKIPASNYTEVYDVTGAGDTVIATLTLALASGASMVEAMKLANYAAGIVIRKAGVATVAPGELEEQLTIDN